MNSSYIMSQIQALEKEKNNNERYIMQEQNYVNNYQRQANDYQKQADNYQRMAKKKCARRNRT